MFLLLRDAKWDHVIGESSWVYPEPTGRALTMPFAPICAYLRLFALYHVIGKISHISIPGPLMRHQHHFPCVALIREGAGGGVV